MALADVEVFEDAVPLVRSCPALNEIRTSGELKELVIEVKHGAILNAHRIILAARIPSLRAALSGAPGKDNSVLKWPTVPLNLANSLLQYVYTGQLEVTQTNAMAIVMFAKMMRLSDLENWGVRFMANRVNLENLASTWDFARSSNMGLLMEACINLMQAQFTNFVSTHLFIRLPADTVLTLLRNDNLSVDSEEAVFEAISSWVAAGDKECDNERLRLHASEMLKEVRWCQTTLQFRNRLVDSHPIFQDNNSCGRFMALVEQWISNADKDKPPCPFNRRRRTHRTIFFFVFGKDKNQDRWSVLRFDPHLEKEERIADMEKREYATYSLVGESIFVVGGDTAQEGRYSTSVGEFLVAERRWRKRASLDVGRRVHAAAVLTEAGGEALIGVFGGWGNGSRLSSCEVYEVGRDRWFKLPDLREKRSAPAAACLPGDSRIFVFGGHNGSSYLASVEFCHLRADWRERATSSDFWQPAAPMRTARWGLAATHLRGKIIVAGGYGGGNVVEMFTPPDARCPRGQWTDLAGMKEPRAFFSLLTSTDDAIFAVGCWLGSGNTVETFTAPGGPADVSNDLTSWSWSSKKPLETLEKIAGAASIRMSNRPERRTALVARELTRYKVDIAALSETRFSEQGQLEVVRAGYTFFWSGRPRAERRDAGVLLAIRNDIVGRLTSLPQGINDRLMSLRLPLRQAWGQIRHHHQRLRSADEQPRRRRKGQILRGPARPLGDCVEGGQVDCLWRLQHPRRHRPYCLERSAGSPWSPRLQRQWSAAAPHLLRTLPHPDEDLFLSVGAREGHLEASSVPSVAPAGLRPRPEARSAGRAGDKGDRGNEQAQRLDKIPIDDAADEEATIAENASVEDRWCQLRNTVQATTLAVLGLAPRQQQDWFDDNEAAIRNLLAEKNRLHKAYVDHPTDDNKAAFSRRRRQLQQ
nr:unnamed protein product [Spirometra erinaceieuropaei]